MGPFVPPKEPLSDGRLALRPFDRHTDEDIDALAFAVDDIDLAAWLVTRSGDQRSDAQALLTEWAEGWARGTVATFCVLDDGRLRAAVAAIVTRDPEVAELGIWVHRDARRRGLATNAVKLVTAWCFGSGIERVWVEIDPINEPSHALAQSVGFMREGTLRAHCRDRRSNKRHDCVVYSLVPADLSGRSDVTSK